MTDNPSVLFCVPLDTKCDKETKKDNNFTKSKLKNETMKNLICHLNQNIPKNPKLIIKEAEKWNFLDAFKKKGNNIVKKDIIMFKYHLCANYDLVLNLKSKYHSFKFSFYGINVKVFLYKSENLNSLTGIDFFNFNFRKSDKYISSLVIKQTIIYYKRYWKICMKKEKNKKRFCSKINCYKRCFRNRKNDFRFLYTKEDNFLLKFENESISSVNSECFSKCFKKIYGVFYYLMSTKFENRKTKDVNFIFEHHTTEIRPKYLKTKKIFFLEITSLIGILIGFNYLSFMCNCLNEFVKIFKINKVALIKKTEIIFFIFIIANLLIDCFYILKVYKKFFLVKTSIIRSPNQSNQFSFSACFDIKKIIDIKKNNSQIDLIKPLEKNNIFTLAKHTMKFDSLLIKAKIGILRNYDEIYLEEEKFSTFFLSEKLSKKSKLNIYKCFFIHPNLKKILFRGLIDGFSIFIKFNKLMSFFFLTNEKTYPNSLSKKFFFKNKFRILETILDGDKSILRCKIYKNKCQFQRECIDQCILSNYSEKYLKLPPKIPIFLNFYDVKNKEKLIFDSKNDSEFEKLEKYCSNLFPLIDCYQKIYDPYKMDSENKTNKIFIYSKRFIRTDFKSVVLNKNDLVNNILTCFNVWIGINFLKMTKKLIFKIYKKIVCFFQMSLNKSSIFGKLLKFLINLLLLCGLIYNLYSLSSGILKQNKIASVEYKFSTKVEYPVVTICVDYKEKFNFTKKMKVNGNLLDKITYSANDIFESINYIDNYKKMQSLKDLNELEKNKENNILELSHFYFMKLKCFKVKYKTNLPFYFFYETQNSLNYLKISFKSNITKYYLTLETNKTFNFGRFIKLYKQKNIIHFIKTTIEYKDSFSYLKEFFSIFNYENQESFYEEKFYFEILKKKFKENKNFSTLMLPLDENYFNLTINNIEFKKFFSINIEKFKKENSNKSYSAEYYLKTISLFLKSNVNELKLKPVLVTIETIIEDKIPIENFFLVVLNIIYFWYNLSLIDIIKHFLVFIKATYFLLLIFLNLFYVKTKNLIIKLKNF